METSITQVVSKGKILIKALIIGGLVLVLMIPAIFVYNLIEERQMRQQEAVAEVSSKWAGAQNISGPFLVIPYYETVLDEKKEPVVYKRNAYFLPEYLQYKSTVEPVKRYRGIYEVMLYTSVNSLQGFFSKLPFNTLKISKEQIIWNEAFIAMHITDSRGLKEALKITWNGETIPLQPTPAGEGILKASFTAPVVLSEKMADTSISFAATVNLNGSQQLTFKPLGKETVVDMQSQWPDPSFSGVQLPDTSDISNTGFQAQWRSFSHKRNYPQAWTNTSNFDHNNAAFGVDLFIPVTAYQKTLRSVKYAVLCILLTFAAFFLIETVHKISVHPFQYVLIGLALILFYTLLLSFSEYISFNWAYAIAALATIGLIGWFVKSLLQSSKLSYLLSFILLIMYGYIFTLLQLQDYALLLGSLGLFITLAIIMNYSRRISW